MRTLRWDLVAELILKQRMHTEPRDGSRELRIVIEPRCRQQTVEVGYGRSQDAPNNLTNDGYRRAPGRELGIREQVLGWKEPG